MTLARTIPPITASNEEIRAKLETADLPPLLPTLAYITGDLSLLRPELRIDPLLLADPEQAGLTPEQQEAIRDLATEVLGRFRDTGATTVDDDDDLQTIVEFLAGGEPMDEYMEMLVEELALHGGDLRAPQWRRDELAPDRPFHVAIVGSGMSGIIAAYRLKQAGVDFTIFEKNDDVGGTWKENTYPGCRVDVPNHFYSLLVRPARRLAVLLLAAARAARLLPPLRRRVRHPRPHRAQHRGVVRRVRRRRRPLDVGVERTRQRVDVHRRRGDQRRRPAQSTAVPEHRGAGQLRRPGVPLRRVGPQRRSGRQAGRRHRHGLQRGAVRPDHRRAGRHARGLPAHTELAVPLADLPRGRAGRLPMAAGAHPLVPRVVPLLAVLQGRRDAPADRRGRPGLAGPVSIGQRAERRDAPAAHRGDRGAVPGPSRPAVEGGAAVPAGVEADHRRQRRVGDDAAPRQRRRSPTPASPRSSRRAWSRRTARCTSSTC